MSLNQTKPIEEVLTRELQSKPIGSKGTRPG